MNPFPRWARLPLFFAFSAMAFSTTAHASDTIVLRVQSAQRQYEFTAPENGIRRLIIPVDSRVDWLVTSGSERLAADNLVLGLPFIPGEQLRVDRKLTPDGGLTLEVIKTSAPTNQPSLAKTIGDHAERARLAEHAGLKPEDADKLSLPQLKLAEAISFDPANKADFAIPEAPAAAVLSQDSQLLRPTTPRETLTSVLGNFEDGKLKTGFALGITPYTQFRKRPISLRQYNDDGMKRFLTNLQISVAAKAGAEATATDPASPALFGLGLSGVFFDKSDSRLDAKFRESLNKLVEPIARDNLSLHEKIARGEALDGGEIADSYFEQYEAIATAAERARWNAPAMGFGYAMRLKSASGKVEDAKEDGGSVWLNLALPGFGAFDQNSQFLFSGNYRYHDTFTRNEVTGIEDSLNLGAQWRVGTANFNAYVEGFYSWHSPKNMPKTSEMTWEVGLERRLMEGLWLNLGYSNDDSLGGGKQVKTGLRYGFGKAAALSSDP